ncbi:MAG: hypothetical protein ACRYFK_14335 [Janthinobacterium lividum]
MTPTKQAEREKALEVERDTAAAERDDYKAKHEAAVAERDTATGERDDYKAKYEQADEARQQAEAQRDQLLDEAGKPQDSTEQTEATAPADSDPHAETKALLKRNGLKEAYQMPDGSICFDKKHAVHMLGEEGFHSLTKISAE